MLLLLDELLPPPQLVEKIISIAGKTTVERTSIFLLYRIRPPRTGRYGFAAPSIATGHITPSLGILSVMAMLRQLTETAPAAA
jgi:hypothetical protein